MLFTLIVPRKLPENPHYLLVLVLLGGIVLRLIFL